MAVKVLILEDNPVARSFLCRVVRESFSDTIAITEAGDLENARAQINLAGGASGLHGVDPFKLILVDLELPDGNGMELLAELTQYPATKIVTTLYSDDDHLFPALQCGADGYLLKEDRFEVLVEELQKIVRGQPPLSPAIARTTSVPFSIQVADVDEDAVKAVHDPADAAGLAVERIGGRAQNVRVQTFGDAVLPDEVAAFDPCEVVGIGLDKPGEVRLIRGRCHASRRQQGCREGSDDRAPGDAHGVSNGCR